MRTPRPRPTPPSSWPTGAPRAGGPRATCVAQGAAAALAAGRRRADGRTARADGRTARAVQAARAGPRRGRRVRAGAGRAGGRGGRARLAAAHLRRRGGAGGRGRRAGACGQRPLRVAGRGRPAGRLGRQRRGAAGPLGAGRAHAAAVSAAAAAAALPGGRAGVPGRDVCRRELRAVPDDRARAPARARCGRALLSAAPHQPGALRRVPGVRGGRAAGGGPASALRRAVWPAPCCAVCASGRRAFLVVSGGKPRAAT